MVFVTAVGSFKPDDVWIINPILAVLIVLCGWIGIVAVIVGVFYIINAANDAYLVRKYKNKNTYQKSSLVKSRFKAWKEKNCPIINWK